MTSTTIEPARERGEHRPPHPAAPGAAPVPLRAVGHSYPHLARAIPHRRYWWRPVVAVAVAGTAYLIMNLQLMVPLLLLGVIWPAFAPSDELMDPLNAMDQLLGLGSLALLLPAVLVGTLAGYGRAGIAHSVLGRFRWGLLGRAAIVVAPVYVLINLVANLVLERGAVVLPALSASALIAWGLTLLLVPLQAAGEEYAFRALPMQALGTWLRWPIIGILVPVPLFVMGHGYSWLGQVDIAVFALAMGALAWKTGGIEIPVLLHVANNWTLFAIAPLIPGLIEQGEVSVTGFLQAIIPMLLLTAGIWWWFSRREHLGLWEPFRAREPLR
ncbi:CPBP family intramembrane glutamic endopeptidase [Brachybacterium sp. UNK5269]|uniref:CPBP family intramembrane glutamic endopeptidase n=1 Tax=Brachybacterium sp. UNK5269 TaxID=3408576 RepID=UPI003BAE965F